MKTQNIEVKKQDDGMIEITGEIAVDAFESYRDRALTIMGEHVELPGFRKGKVPKDMLVKNIGEVAVLEEMAELALGEAYPEILESEKIDAIGRPEITITKIAAGNPLGFKIKTAVMPVIEIGDYKSIAKKEAGEKETVDVADEEVESSIKEIRKMRAKHEESKNHVHDENTPHEHKTEFTDEELPVLDDEFVKSLGKFENIEDFKTKLKENIKFEKELALREKRRLKMLDGVIADAKVTIPRLLVDLELDKIVARFKSDVARMGIAFEEYLKSLGKTEEDMRTEFAKDAEKRAKLELILNHISIKESIKPSEEEIGTEVDRLLTEYKDADPVRARAYIENILTNEKVIKFLEEQ